MDSLIMQILELEEKAQEIIKEAKNADKKLDEEIEKEASELKQFIDDGSKHRSEEKIKAIKWDVQKKCEEIENTAEKNIKALESKYEQNKEAWVDKLFSDILS